MEWLELKIPPVVVGLLVAFMAWWSGTAGLLAWSVATWHQTTSAVLVVIGALIAIAGVVSFYQARTTVNPHKPGNTSSLVTSGIYRWTRNPMYLGMFLVLLAWAIGQGGLLPMLATLLFIPYMTRFQIVPEERVMLMMFGEEFERYSVRVRRWV